MSKKGKSKPRSRRLNLRALIVLAVLVVVAVPGVWAFKMVRDQFGAAAILKEANAQIEKKNPTLAIGYLNRYLELVPDDLDAMELKSKILFETAQDQTQAMEALKFHGQMIATSPKDERWEQARRRMVKLNLMVHRWQSALEVAKQLKTDDAERHRLYARASAAVGVLEKNKEAIDKARLEYEAAEAKEPGDVESAEELARIYRDQLDNPDKALQVLDQVVKNTGNSPKKEAAALLARARHYSATQQADKAAADVESAVRNDPEGIMPRLVAAEIALQRRQPDLARDHLAKIGADQRKDLREDLRIRNLEGLIDLAESRPEEAIRVWREGLMEIGGNDTALTWQLAHVLLEVGRVTEAEPLMDQYRRLVGGEEEDPKYLYLKALAVLRSNRPAEAATRFEAIRYKVPKTLEPHVNYALGQSYEATRDPAKAMDAYLLAAQQSRKWAPPWKALARLQAQAHPEEAQATLKEGLTLNPDDPELLTSRAQYLYVDQLRKPPQQQSLAEVERLLAQAAKASPGSSDVALFQAELYANTQRPEEALALLKAASDLTPKTPSLWLARANLLTGLNRLGEAQEVLDQAIKTAGPQSSFYITRATILIRQGHLSDARTLLTEGLDRVPKEQKSLVWKGLGDLHQGQKNYDAAAEAFKRWAELQPNNPEPRLSLFQVALLKGDDKAISTTIDELRKVAGERSYYWRFARIEVLTRDRKEPPDAARDAKRLDDAARLIKEIQDNDPQLGLGYLLEGRLCERRKKTDAAINAYRKALERGAGQNALNALLALLSAEKRDKEIQELSKAYPAFAVAIEQSAAERAIQAKDMGRAVALAKQAIEGDPQGLNTRKWEIEVFQRMGKPKEAEAAARKWISEKPTDSTPWLMLLMLQINAQNQAAAAETVELIRQNVKTNRPELLMAQCYRAAGNLAKASDSFQEAVQRWPDDLSVLTAAVTFYEQTGRQHDAEETLRLIRRRDPSSVWATRKLALSLASHPVDRPAWDEAMELVGADSRRNDVPDDLIIRAAIIAQVPGPDHLVKAEAILEGLLAELPERTDVREQLARMLFAGGEFEKARPHAAKAAEAGTASPDTVLFYANLLLVLKDIPAAEKQLARLARIEPDGLPIVELDARIRAAKGQAEEGAKLLEKAYEARATSPEGLIIAEAMIRALISLKQLDAAERVARRAAEVAPRGHCLLAELLVLRGRLDDAADQLEQVAKGGDPKLAGATALALAAQPAADPRWTALADRLRSEADKAGGDAPTLQSLEKLALLRHLQKNHKEEVEIYHKMIDLKPTNFLLLNNLAWTLCEDLGQADEALKVVEQAIEKGGKHAHVLDTRGVIYTRLGKYEEAVKDLEAAARDLNDPSVQYHLARAYLKLGKPDEAKKARERSLKDGLTRERLQEAERADWDAVMKP